MATKTNENKHEIIQDSLFGRRLGSSMGVKLPRRALVDLNLNTKTMMPKKPDLISSVSR